MNEDYLAYVFGFFGAIFFLYIIFEDAISYYRLQENKSRFWKEYFPNFIKKEVIIPLAMLIALLMILWFIGFIGGRNQIFN